MTSITSPPVAAAVPAGRRIAAILVLLTAVGIAGGSLVALAELRLYQVVLNLIGAVALGYGGALLLRGRPAGRPWAVTLTWLAAFAVTAESGDHQARMNDTGALGSRNTEYFLPAAVWVAILALFVIAIAVVALTKRVRGS